MSLRKSPTLTLALVASNRGNAKKSTGPGRREARLDYRSIAWGMGGVRDWRKKSEESAESVDAACRRGWEGIRKTRFP